MLDPDEMAWLDEQLHRRCRAPPHRHVAALPAAARPARPRGLDEARRPRAPGAARSPRFGEKVRQAIDLEHWAAFHEASARWLEMVMEVARGRAGPGPATVVFLSGDVHHSYVAEVDAARRPRGGHASCRRSVRRSATRCHGRGGSMSASRVGLAWPMHGSSRDPRTSRSRRIRWRITTARGSTTALPPWRSTGAARGSPGSPPTPTVGTIRRCQPSTRSPTLA